jgi:hypothetical protein
LGIVEDVKNKRLEWIGHIVKMEHGRIFKESKTERRRRMGRKRLRGLIDVEENLWHMKVKRCRQITVNKSTVGVCNLGDQGVRRSQSQGIRKKVTYSIRRVELHYTFRFWGTFMKYIFKQLTTIRTTKLKFDCLF